MARGSDEPIGVDEGASRKPKLTVACVLSEGDGRRTYDASHVARLQKMVAEHLDMEHRFVCLTNDQNVSCETIQLQEGWLGWWAKIELFRPGLFEGRVLYLDLDVTVVGSLDDLINYAGSFVAIEDWLRPTINSSVMVWKAGALDHVFKDLTATDIRRLPGDQDWITEKMADVSFFPRRWCCSWRRDVRTFGQVREGTKVVVFHGFPKPWEVAAVG